MMNYCICLRLY